MRVRTEFDPKEGTDIFWGGNDGRDAGGYAPGASAYYVHKIAGRWRLGISLTAPIAGAIDYKNDWLGRYYVTEVSALSLNLNPALSFKVNDWLSVGAGFNAAYMTLDYTLKIPNVSSIVVPTAVRMRLEEAAANAPFPPLERFLEGAASMVPDPAPKPDAKLELEDLDDVAYGWNVGLLFTPCEGTRIGLTYRSELDFDLAGDFDTEGLGELAASLGLSSGDAGSQFDAPQIAVLSLYQQLPQLGWTLRINDDSLYLTGLSVMG